MSQNLTQPEEIDLILMTMADHDPDLDVPITEKEYITRIFHEFTAPSLVFCFV